MFVGKSLFGVSIFGFLLMCSNAGFKKKKMLKYTGTRLRFGYDTAFVRIRKDTAGQRLGEVAVLDGRNRYYPGDKTRSYVNVTASSAASVFVTLVKAADLTFEKIVDDILFDKRNWITKRAFHIKRDTIFK